jgi:hypothetical protein
MRNVKWFSVAAAVFIVAAAVAMWSTTGAFQSEPPPDLPDPTSALLPPVVSDEEWYEYDKEWTEKLAPEIEYTEPIDIYGPDMDPGSIIVVMGEEYKLPDDVYLAWYEMHTTCMEDPHGVCGLAPFYAIHRVGAETTSAEDGEIVIASRGKRAWFWPSLHPDHRPEVRDAYIDFVQSIGIEEIEDIGYVEPYVGEKSE